LRASVRGGRFYMGWDAPPINHGNIRVVETNNLNSSTGLTFSGNMGRRISHHLSIS
jgi:hypothetical protein